MLKLFAALFLSLSVFAAQSADLSLKAENSKVGEFDFAAKRVLLNSGYYMPIVGLGTYSLNHDECMLSVGTLLKSGGRLIDTAYISQ